MANVPNPGGGGANPSISFQADISGVENQLKRLTTLFAGTGAKLSETFSALAGGIGAQRFISASVREYQKFGDEIARTSALSGATRKEMLALTNTAASLGRTTEHTAGRVASAMSNLALAGFKTEEIIAAMPGLLATATAGLVGLEQAVSTGSQVLRAFHLDAGQMNYVAGSLTATFTSTNTVLSDLDYTMKYAGADAHELGVSLAQLSAAAGVLGNVGIRGTIAGTGLREFISRIGSTLAENRNQLKNTREALKQLGITYKDVSDEAGNLSLVKSVNALEQAFERMGMKAEERLKALRPIFGARAGAQVTSLIGQGAEVLQAKELEVTFGGMKQQLDGLLEQAMRMPEGVHGIKVSSEEIAENFITIGNQGAANLARIEGQMRDLGLVGGFLNTQVGVTRETVKKINGENIRKSVFVPMEELGRSTYRTVDTLVRLQKRLAEVGDESEKLTILQDIFGSDPRVLEQAIAAFNDGGKSMAEFANNLIRATSALDVQKKQLNTVTGSMKLMQSAFEAMQIQLGAVYAPIARVFAMISAGMFQVVSGSASLTSIISDFQENTGGLSAQIEDMKDAINNLSVAGKVLAVVGAAIAATAPFVALASFLVLVKSLGAVSGWAGINISNLNMSLLKGATAFAVTTGVVSRYFNGLRDVGSTIAVVNILLNSLIAKITKLYVTGKHPFMDSLRLAIGQLVNFKGGWQNLLSSISVVKHNIGMMFSSKAPFTFFQGIISGFQNIQRVVQNTTVFANVAWRLFVETLAYTAFDLIPVLLKGFGAIGDAIRGYGTMALPSVSIGEMQQANPSGGLATSFVGNLEYVLEGVINTIGIIGDLVLRLADALIQATLTLAAMLISIVLEMIANISKLVYDFVMGIFKLLARILIVITTFIRNIAMIMMRFIITSVYYLANTSIAIVTSLVRAIIQSIRIALVQIPLMLVNAILHILAIAMDFLTTLGALMIRVGAVIIANTLNWTMYIFTSIIKITALIALLPVTLPYLFYQAFKQVMGIVGDELESGSNAIISVFKTLGNTLWDIAVEFANTLKAGIIRQFKDIVSMIFGIITSLVNVPLIIARIVTVVYTTITSTMASIYNGIVAWLDALPYTIAHYILRLWAFVSNTISTVLTFLRTVSSFVGDLVIQGISTVYKIFAALVTELPFLILRIVAHAFQAMVTGFISTVLLAMMQIRSIVLDWIVSFRLHFITQVQRTFNILTYAIPNMVKMIQNTAFMALQKFAEIVRQIIVDLPNWLTRSLISLADFLKETVKTLPQKIVEATLQALDKAFYAIMDVIFGLLYGLFDLFDGAMTTAQADLAENAVAYIEQFPEIMMIAIAKAWDTFVTGMNKLWAKIKAVDWALIGDLFTAALERIFVKIEQTISNVINIVMGIAETGTEHFIAALTTWIDIDALVSIYGKDISKLYEKIIGLIQEYWDRFTKSMTRLWALLAGIDFWGHITQVLSVIYTQILKGTGWLREQINALPSGPITDIIKQFIGGILDMIESGVKIAQSVMPVIRENWNRLMGALYTGAVSGIGVGLRFIVGGLTMLAGAFFILGKIMWAIIDIVAEISGVFGDLSATLAAGDMRGVVQQIIDGVVSLAEGDYSQLIMVLSNIIVRVGMTAIRFIGAMLVGIFFAIEDALLKHFPILGAMFYVLVRSMAASFMLIGAILSGIAIAFVAAFSYLYPIAAAVVVVFMTLATFLPRIITGISSLITYFVVLITTLFTGTWTFRSLFNSTLDFILNSVMYFGDTLADIITWPFRQLYNFILGIYRFFAGLFGKSDQNTASGTANITSGLFPKLGTWILNATDDIVLAIGAATTAVITALVVNTNRAALLKAGGGAASWLGSTIGGGIGSLFSRVASWFGAGSVANAARSTPGTLLLSRAAQDRGAQYFMARNAQLMAGGGGWWATITATLLSIKNFLVLHVGKLITLIAAFPFAFFLKILVLGLAALGLINVILEKLFGWDLGGFWQPFKAIVAFLKNFPEMLAKLWQDFGTYLENLLISYGILKKKDTTPEPLKPGNTTQHLLYYEQKVGKEGAAAWGQQQIQRNIQEIQIEQKNLQEFDKGLDSQNFLQRTILEGMGMGLRGTAGASEYIGEMFGGKFEAVGNMLGNELRDSSKNFSNVQDRIEAEKRIAHKQQDLTLITNEMRERGYKISELGRVTPKQNEGTAVVINNNEQTIMLNQQNQSNRETVENMQKAVNATKSVPGNHRNSGTLPKEGINTGTHWVPARITTTYGR